MERIQPTAIEYYGNVKGTEVYIKHDDRIPFSFGGNKVRIAVEIFEEMKARGSRAVVTYGSPTSNLNRVMVHMAAAEGIPCTCIVNKDSCEGGHPSFNEIMVLDSGAEVVYTEPENVRETVAAVLNRLSAKGLNPYYIYGSETGKGGEEVLSRAYRKVFGEICQQEKELGVKFNTIALPVGTGATLSGLVSACDEEHEILGISVARTRERAGNCLREALTACGMSPEEIAARTGTASSEDAVPPSLVEVSSSRMQEPSPRVRITDEYLLGGYGKYTGDLTEFIRANIRERGMALDPVYSGKAFYGLMKELEKNNKDRSPEKGSNVGCDSGTHTGRSCLFIHTGGLPLFFDLMEQM